MFKEIIRHITAVLAGISMFCSCDSPLESKFRELDEVIGNREVYRSRFESGADSLRAELANACTDSARWECAHRLYSAYRLYQIDSAILYFECMTECCPGDFVLRNMLCEADVSISLRDYSNAGRILASLDTLSMTPDELARYYNTLMLLYANEAVDEFLPAETRAEMVKLRYDTRKKYLACSMIDPFEKVRRRGIMLYEDGEYKAAESLLEELWAGTVNIHDKAAAAYSLACAYQSEQNTEMAAYWFAQSTIHDIQEPARSYLSLYELSKILFEEKDLARASYYSQCALDDALACSYNPRIFNSASSQLDIVKAVEYQKDRERDAYMIIMAVIMLLSSVIAVLMVRTYRQSRALRRTHRLLEEANRIKEGYVHRYIGLSADYLARIEDFRHDLRVAIKEGNTAAVNDLLRNPRYSEDEYKHFYGIFDETFLGLYPEFVDKVNSLLKPEARFEVSGKRLPTGLRILAAIKLGITDSGSIAEFLTCAPSSVYTHRSKLKKSALCDPSEFEKRIVDI